jgi:predicted esterase
MAAAVHSIREECEVRGGRRTIVDFQCAGERFAGILLVPDCPGPSAAALLLHGFTLDKERMAQTAGIALLARGVASLAIDLPLHGERYRAVNVNAISSPFDLIRRWRAALEEAAAALAYLGSRAGIDPGRLAVVGYSLGAYLGLKLASDQKSVRALVVAAGGDLPEYVPFAGIVRAVADPLKLVRKLAGRPVLVVHGRHDRTIPAVQAERLFEAAGQPKEIRWWEAGHVLPPEAIDDAATWLADRFRGSTVDGPTGSSGRP